MSLLPLLAPRPGQPMHAPTPPTNRLCRGHVLINWSEAYPEIERLYLQEKRKLRHVIEYMERMHGFKASEQMYKKRLAKWRIRKNTPRSPTNACKPPTKDGKTNKKSTSCQVAVILRNPKKCPRDRLTFILLTSVRTWSMAFFDSVQKQPTPQTPREVSLTAVTPEATSISHAFDLVGELLRRGQGTLAGRVARRAFLLVEKMFLLDAPALVWNFLEVMHKLVAMSEMRLLQALLSHSIALITHQQQSEGQPIRTILTTLNSLVNTVVQNDSQEFPFIQTPSVDSAQSELSFFLEKAFIANASVLFDRFDLAYSQLYFGMVWDACSLNLPVPLVSRWLELNTSSSKTPQTLKTHGLNRSAAMKSTCNAEEDILHQHLLVPRLDASPPSDFGTLRNTSIAALRAHSRYILSDPGLTASDGKKGRLPRAIASLHSIQFLEDPSLRSTDDPKNNKVARSDAAQIACIMQSVMDMDDAAASMHGSRGIRGPGGLSPLDIVDRTRAMVALRAYAHGESNPIVLYDMLLLQNALTTAGEHAEAEAVGSNAYQQLDRYLEPIPIDTP